MTTAADREVLRAWRDTHSNVRPAPGDARCVQAVWVDGVYAVIVDVRRSGSWITRTESGRWVDGRIVRRTR